MIAEGNLISVTKVRTWLGFLFSIFLSNTNKHLRGNADKDQKNPKKVDSWGSSDFSETEVF